jgi:cell division FtsZ-interacting protein ZapD
MEALTIRKTKKRVIFSISQTTLSNMPMTRIMEWLRLEMLAQEIKFNETALDTIETQVSLHAVTGSPIAAKRDVFTREALTPHFDKILTEDHNLLLRLAQ